MKDRVISKNISIKRKLIEYFLYDPKYEKIILIAAILVEKFANYIFRRNKVKYIWPMGKFPKKEIVYGMIVHILRTSNIFRFHK
jgi:hypothetical protein